MERGGPKQFDQLAIITLSSDSSFSEWGRPGSGNAFEEGDGTHTCSCSCLPTAILSVRRAADRAKRCQTDGGKQRLLSPLFTPPNVDPFPEAPPPAEPTAPRSKPRCIVFVTFRTFRARALTRRLGNVQRPHCRTYTPSDISALIICSLTTVHLTHLSCRYAWERI